jgi:hypothetical protein
MRGRRTRLALSFTKAGKRVARVRFKRAARRRAKVRVSGVAATGVYRWTLKARKRKLARGRVRVGAVADLKASAPFVVRLR